VGVVLVQGVDPRLRCKLNRPSSRRLVSVRDRRECEHRKNYPNDALNHRPLLTSGACLNAETLATVSPPSKIKARIVTDAGRENETLDALVAFAALTFSFALLHDGLHGRFRVDEAIAIHWAVAPADQIEELALERRTTFER